MAMFMVVYLEQFKHTRIQFITIINWENPIQMKSAEQVAYLNVGKLDVALFADRN